MWHTPKPGFHSFHENFMKDVSDFPSWVQSLKHSKGPTTILGHSLLHTMGPLGEVPTITHEYFRLVWDMWRFPKMGVPPTHPFLFGSNYGDTHICGNLHMSWRSWYLGCRPWVLNGWLQYDLHRRQFTPVPTTHPKAVYPRVNCYMTMGNQPCYE